MSSKTLRTIRFQLTPESIDKAIQELYEFQNDLQLMCEELARKLVSDGVEIARMKIVAMDAVFTGDLWRSIQGVYFEEEHCGVIFTDAPHALFVEFGTGIVGENGPHHPWQEAYGWRHDVHNHEESGWWYKAPWGWYISEDGQPLAWTNGMISRPFMYETLAELEKVAQKEGLNAFAAVTG